MVSVCEAVWCREAKAEDPVRMYVAVRLASGELLELIELATEPGVCQFFDRGRRFGTAIKLSSPTKKGLWWQEIFTLQERHTWLVSLHNQLYGEIGFKYPVSNHSRLWIEWDKHSPLPVNLGNVLCDDWHNLVVPHDSPVVCEPDLLRMHFLLSVFFRMMFSFDFRS